MVELTSDSTNIASRFFAWWGAELAALIPAPLRRVVVRPRQIRAVEFTRDAVVFADYRGDQVRELGRVNLGEADGARDPAALAQARQFARGAPTTAILIPADQALFKVLTLPAMSKSDLRDALAFQIDRQTPFSPDDVYFDYRVAERDSDAKRVSVELAVAPRAVIEEAANTARQFGFQPSFAGIQTGDGSSPFAFNLLPRAMAHRRRNFRPLAGVAALVIVCAAVWLMAQNALEQKTAEADALTERVELARERADRLQALAAQRDALIAESQFLKRRKAEAPKPVLFVEELTRVLPDHTWLFHLQQDGSRLRLSGYTSDASSLIGLIGELPMFRDPRFGSPVTHDPRRDKDRFNLVIDIVSGSGETAPENNP